MIAPEKQAKGPIYTVVVSEKGGAERREVFDRTELSVGRVQGNDLMLPKGNVSKRHARLLYRDGRFIVTDLNSTNGTYVNRRRISQATIVREGDRIYIGDFVLRIELNEGGAEVSANEVGSGSASVSGSGLVPSRQQVPSSSQASQPDIALGQPEGDDSGSSYPRVPGPPRVPFAARPPLDSVPQQEFDSGPRPHEPSRPSAAEISPSVPDERISLEALQHRQVLGVLVERVRSKLDAPVLAGELDDSIVGRIERSLGEQLAQLRAEGELPPSLNAESLQRDARLELTGFGPLTGLLEDGEVSEAVVSRFDRVSASRTGRNIAIEPPFSSEASLRLALARLCRLSGIGLSADERVVERRLPSGARLSAVLAPAGHVGTLLVLRKPRKADASLDGLVRRGAISRAIATFLGHLVAARANVLVVGPRGSGVPMVVSALAAAASDGRLIAVQDLDELVASEAAARLVPTDPQEAARLVQVAARTPDARLAVDIVSPEVAAATIEAIGEGADGVVAALRAPSLRRALPRLAGEIAAMRIGTTPALAREWVSNAFDIVLEVARLRDGRHRVLRVVELAAGSGDEIQTQDVFTFVIERTAAGGAVEGTFSASGVVPRVAEEMVGRGIHVETSLFTRPPSR